MTAPDAPDAWTQQQPLMRSDVFVYLSGPMTAKHGVLMEENVAAGLRVHLDLLRRGVPNFCPQLSGAFPSAWADVPWDRWIAFDLAVIDRCSHMLMLPRWETSKGALVEKAYAEARGIPVLFDAALLPAVSAAPALDSPPVGGRVETRNGKSQEADPS